MNGKKIGLATMSGNTGTRNSVAIAIYVSVFFMEIK